LSAQRALWAVNLALMVLLVYGVAHWAGGGGGGETGPPPGQSAGSRRAARLPAAPVTRQDCVVVLNRGIFSPVGPPRESSVVEEKPAEPAPPAPPLRLKLIGTMAGDRSVSRALIEDETTSQGDMYRIGDSIQGAVIEQIERNRVYVLHGNLRKILQLQVTPLRASPAPPSGRGARPVRPPTPDVGPVGGYASSAVVPDRVVSDRRNIYGRIRALEQVLRSGTATPRVVEGRTEGLLLGESEGAGLRTVGLSPGDILLTVNGRPLVNGPQACEVLRTAEREGVVDVKLRRGEEEMVVRFGLRR
jgi:general secretion pathway protein C